MGLADRADRFGIPSVVQHDTAAAIDLEIDESRHQQATIKLDPRTDTGNALAGTIAATVSRSVSNAAS